MNGIRREEHQWHLTQSTCWLDSWSWRRLSIIGFKQLFSNGIYMLLNLLKVKRMGFSGNRNGEQLTVLQVLDVRGAIDGLAGIGRGNTLVPTGAWPPTRFVFSHVPFGTGNRNGQQAPANDDSETRTEHNGDLAGDGLTALVGLSQGGSYETDPQSRFNGSGPSITGTSTSGIAVQMLDSPELGIEWENPNSSSISLDMKTPLNHFPPFRFG